VVGELDLGMGFGAEACDPVLQLVDKMTSNLKLKIKLTNLTEF
jgi:hypothetical protein